MARFGPRRLYGLDELSFVPRSGASQFIAERSAAMVLIVCGRSSAAVTALRSTRKHPDPCPGARRPARPGQIHGPADREAGQKGLAGHSGVQIANHSGCQEFPSK